MAKAKENNTIKVKLTGSLIGQTKSVRATIRGLGLRRLNSVATLEDTASIRGMVGKASHLVKIVN